MHNTTSLSLCKIGNSRNNHKKKKMNGIKLNMKQIKDSITEWADPIVSQEKFWGSNYVYINEISGLANIKREDWIETTLNILSSLSERYEKQNSLLLFLHICLKFSKKSIIPHIITYPWLEKMMNLSTPPSFHFTSVDYLTSFYFKHFIMSEIDSSITSKFPNTYNLCFFYTPHYYPNDSEYCDSLYVFYKRPISKILSKVPLNFQGPNIVK